VKRNLYFSIVAFTMVFLPLYLFGQKAPYSYQFNYTTGTAYTPLGNNAAELIGATGWDDEVVPFSLPFDFYYKGILVHDWTMSTYGGLYPTTISTPQEIPPIAAFYSDYVDRGNSWIGYEITGNAGSRIAKVEFKDLGYFSDASLTDFANFQIWLYEGSNKIEYHAGSSKISKDRFNVTSEYGDIIISGLNYTSNDAQSTSDIFHFIGRLNHIPKDSVVTLNSNSGAANPGMIDFINYGIFPESETVFIFESLEGSAPVAVTEIPKENTSTLFPNPVTDNLTIHLNQIPDKGSSFMLYDMAGRELLRSNIELQETNIPVSFLTNGIYIGTIITRGKKKTARIVKQ
jgi:hypothetical protein